MSDQSEPAEVFACGDVPYRCDGFDPADWPPGEIPAMVLQVQIRALIEGLQQEQAERIDLAGGMFMDGNKSYQQGYADGLGRCVQALQLLEDG